MPKVLSDTFDYNGIKIPLEVYAERRRSTHVSMGADAILVRLPSSLSDNRIRAEILKAIEWSKKHFSKKPSLVTKYELVEYPEHFTLDVIGGRIDVHLMATNNKASSGRMVDGNMRLYISQSLVGRDRNRTIQTLISRVLARDKMSLFSSRVDAINDKYFNERIGKVRLKNNRSNWGSCSSKRNLNFSTRILLAPVDVIDYVIIHELSHLIEMNHSHRFWKIVATADPTYKKKEKWLKKHGHLCDF